MSMKHILVASSAAFALAVGNAALAEQPKTPMVSGDEPMNVGQGAQIKAPVESAKAQKKTQEMLSKESEAVSGDYPNERGGMEKMVKSPDPNAKKQAATQKDLEKEDNPSGAISGKDD